tara:strand:+ start:2421 stop:2564 length:144 start_codon:yes stop_codon:yes gene_type:complete
MLVSKEKDVIGKKINTKSECCHLMKLAAIGHLAMLQGVPVVWSRMVS